MFKSSSLSILLGSAALAILSQGCIAQGSEDAGSSTGKLGITPVRADEANAVLASAHDGRLIPKDGPAAPAAAPAPSGTGTGSADPGAAPAPPSSPTPPDGSGAGAPPAGGSEGGAPPAGSGAPPAGGSEGGAPPAGGGSASPSPTPSSTPTGGQRLVNEVARELSIMTSSTYDHTTSVDESRGVFNFDCSGFVGYAIQNAAPSALMSVEAATVARPKAKDFESFFASVAGHTGGWSRVGRAADLTPGDVIAWLEPADIVSKNTGHVLIVLESPTASGKRSDEVLVRIADATSTPHGPTDARMIAGTNGLGTATIGLLVDGSGNPIGFKWSGDSSPKDEYTTVALGRID